MTNNTMMAIKIASGVAVVAIGAYKIVKSKKDKAKESKNEGAK